MYILPIAPLTICVSSLSQATAKELYAIIDSAIARLPSVCCEVLGGQAVIGALTELDIESALVLARSHQSDLRAGLSPSVTPIFLTRWNFQRQGPQREFCNAMGQAVVECFVAQFVFSVHETNVTVNPQGVPFPFGFPPAVEAEIKAEK
ncbi:MAG: hypothetical protein ACLPWG_01860 [Steroidobacteraceae bacterium]